MFVAAYLSSAEGCAIVAEAVDKSLGGGSLEDLPHSRGGFVVLDENERQKELNLNLLPAVRLDRALPPANAPA